VNGMEGVNDLEVMNGADDVEEVNDMEVLDGMEAIHLNWPSPLSQPLALILAGKLAQQRTRPPKSSSEMQPAVRRSPSLPDPNPMGPDIPRDLATAGSENDLEPNPLDSPLPALNLEGRDQLILDADPSLQKTSLSAPDKLKFQQQHSRRQTQPITPRSQPPRAVKLTGRPAGSQAPRTSGWLLPARAKAGPVTRSSRHQSRPPTSKREPKPDKAPGRKSKLERRMESIGARLGWR
jgi:hypothetical protein